MVVVAGSEAVLRERASAEKWSAVLVQRKKLIDEGVFIEQDGKWVFVKDTEFSRPGAAAAVIHGGSANGLTAWKDKNGKLLKEIESH